MSSRTGYAPYQFTDLRTRVQGRMLKVLFVPLWAFYPKILSGNKEINLPATLDPRFGKDGAEVDHNSQVRVGKLSELEGIGCDR